MFKYKLEKIPAIIRHILGRDCGWVCHYTNAYGFVPECGCPVHDPDEWFCRKFNKWWLDDEAMWPQPKHSSWN